MGRREGIFVSVWESIHYNWQTILHPFLYICQFDQSNIFKKSMYLDTLIYDRLMNNYWDKYQDIHVLK